MTSELPAIAPCPWCKGTRFIMDRSRDNVSVACNTDGCLADGPIRETVAEAIVSWNEIAALPGRVEELEAKLKQTEFELAQARQHVGTIIATRKR